MKVVFDCHIDFQPQTLQSGGVVWDRIIFPSPLGDGLFFLLIYMPEDDKLVWRITTEDRI